MKKVIVVGSTNTDLVIGAPKAPAKGETITGGGFFIARGGKGANQAVAAVRFGGNVAMSAVVGDDLFGKDALKSLEIEKIDTTAVRVSDEANGGVAVITVIDGDNRIILDKGTNALLDESDVDAALSLASDGDILLTQAETPIAATGYALKSAKQKGMTTIFNPAPADKAYEEFFGLCDYLIPNETEAETFGGLDEIKRKTDAVVITTLGGKGYAISKGNEYKEYPCVKIKAVDTTAAGDTFCGVFAVCLAEGKTVERAAQIASAAGFRGVFEQRGSNVYSDERKGRLVYQRERRRADRLKIKSKLKALKKPTRKSVGLFFVFEFMKKPRLK